MIQYTVYGKKFTNKKEALKYHHKIYGHTNYQASSMFDTKLGLVADLTRLKNMFARWH